MQNFVELYKELSNKLITIEQIQWVDLWNDQVTNIEMEHPFPTPAVFLAFRSQEMEDIGTNTQKVLMQVDTFFFYETFADTYHDSFNQNDALKFLDIMDKINKVLHATSGKNYSSMRRVAFFPLDIGGGGNLWNITYECICMDYSSTPEYQEGEFKEINVIAFDV